jgi:hypothetical protein
VTIRKTADLSHPPGISDLLKVAVSKKFLDTRQRLPRIWTSTGVVSSDGTYSNGRTDSVSPCSTSAAATVDPKIKARATAIPHRRCSLLFSTVSLHIGRIFPNFWFLKLPQLSRKRLAAAPTLIPLLALRGPDRLE